MPATPNYQRSFRFSLLTLCLIVTACALFFGVARWTDYLTAAGILLGLAPVVAALTYRRSMESLVFSLFLTGWILPSLFPGHAVAFGASDQISPHFFLLHVYLGEAGFFSRGVVLEHTWEGTHGHIWPIGPWVPGYLMSAGMVTAGAVVLCDLRRATNLVIHLGTAVRPLLVLFAFYSFMFESWWFCVFAGIGYVTYVVFAMVFRHKTKHLDQSERRRRLAGLTLAFYPWWVLTLAATQTAIPFLGWLATFAACSILVFSPEKWFRKSRISTLPPGRRLRVLFGASPGTTVAPSPAIQVSVLLQQLPHRIRQHCFRSR